MIKAIAIDDEPPALKVIENFCANAEHIQLEKTFTKTHFHDLLMNVEDLIKLRIYKNTKIILFMSLL